VRLLPGDVFVAALAVDHQGDEIRLRARRDEQGRFLADDLGRTRFELLDGRIVAEHVVADHSRSHGRTHCGPRARDGIAAKVVFQGVHLGVLLSGVPSVRS
jgi:hypothetical protein